MSTRFRQRATLPAALAAAALALWQYDSIHSDQDVPRIFMSGAAR